MSGAVCPRHPNSDAISTCTRCGTFMCDVCNEGGAETRCPECRERTGLRAFPLNRANWSFSALWDYSWECFKRDWVMLSVAALCLMVLNVVIQGGANLLPLLGTATGSEALTVVLQVIATAIQVVFQGVLTLGFLRLAYDVLQGQKADIGRLFSQLDKLGLYVVTTLLLALIFAVPVLVVGGVAVGVAFVLGGFDGNEAVMAGVFGLALLLALPVIFYYGLPLYLLQPAIAYEESRSPMELIRHCYTLAKGERLSILGVSLAGGLVVFVGLLACCVGIFPATALFQLLLAGLYLALNNEGE